MDVLQGYVHDTAPIPCCTMNIVAPSGSRELVRTTYVSLWDIDVEASKSPISIIKYILFGHVGYPERYCVVAIPLG